MRNIIGNICLGVVLLSLLCLIGVFILLTVLAWQEGYWYIPCFFGVLMIALLGMKLCA
uniref:Transmembrane protein n=1 Tax=viral metagenome TaxID=1070528 RepID=A0A6M3IX68_9ZZZZ